MDKIRNKTIIKTSILGIATNILLSALKFFAGLISGSIAITLDAVNNLSDVASSIITIIGTKLAYKQPDKEHPFGHGRMEYLSALIIAIIILYAGITALIASIKKIITPIGLDYSSLTLIIISTSVLVKIFLGLYVSKVGKKVSSESLLNSGKDALYDAFISASTLIAAIIFIASGVSLEAYLAAIISLIIIKSGLHMLKTTISSLLGERENPELPQEISKTILKFKQVSGVFDIVLHDYGPNTHQGTLHIEVPQSLTANDIDKLTRDITNKVYEKHNVALTAIGIYSTNKNNKQASKIKKRIEDIVFKHDYILQLHGFYIDEEEKDIRFDLVISFDEADKSVLLENIYKEIKEQFPDYKISISPDTDFNLS